MGRLQSKEVELSWLGGVELLAAVVLSRDSWLGGVAALRAALSGDEASAARRRACKRRTGRGAESGEAAPNMALCSSSTAASSAASFSARASQDICAE